MMFKVGLTGGIGSGKTYVARVFRVLGIPVYEADTEARRLMEEVPGLVSRIRELLGSEAYIGNKLNRPFIAAVVFEDRKKLETLNSIVHPAVHDDFMQWADHQHNVPYIIEEAALLFESGGDQRMDLTIVVTADEETRIKRVMERDGTDRESVVARMKNQMDESEKAKKADFIIRNDEREMLLPQITGLHHKIIELKRMQNG